MLKKVKRILLVLLSLPIQYLLIAFICSFISINNNVNQNQQTRTIYLTTNGIHLDIVIPKNNIHSDLAKDLKFNATDSYLSFGWGDENFYINTPTWDKLTFDNAFSAMFLKSTTLMHVTRYQQKHTNWVPIALNNSQLSLLQEYILKTFKTAELKKQLLPNKGYSLNDDFYKAHGSYSLLKTCNTWANEAFKVSGLKASLWTPFDFGLLSKHS